MNRNNAFRRLLQLLPMLLSALLLGWMLFCVQPGASSAQPASGKLLRGLHQYMNNAATPVFDYYGTPTPLNQIGNVTVPEARMLVIKPWEKTMLKAIEKAIQTSDLGLNPNNDGEVIRLIFPELNAERRKDLTKQVKKGAEDAKVAVRAIRRDAIEQVKKLKKDSLITEDDQRKAEEDAQKLTDKAIKEIDTVAAAKEKEIMEV
mgnify:CR=1 FL=1